MTEAAAQGLLTSCPSICLFLGGRAVWELPAGTEQQHNFSFISHRPLFLLLHTIFSLKFLHKTSLPSLFSALAVCSATACSGSEGSWPGDLSLGYDWCLERRILLAAAKQRVIWDEISPGSSIHPLCELKCVWIPFQRWVHSCSPTHSFFCTQAAIGKTIKKTFPSLKSLPHNGRDGS